MSERLLKCPLCKSGHFLNHKEITDYSLSKQSFIVCKCMQCELLFTNPRPNEEEIGPYYDFPDYFSHEDKAKNLTQWIYNQVRNYNLGQKIKLIEEFAETGKLLDYGCGTGQLLFEATINLWKVNGIEPNAKARDKANQKLGNKVFTSIDELKEEQTYDAITLFHVLEHVHQLRKTTKTILKHLKSKGYLFIAVPNHESFDSQHYGKYWAGWDVPRHLYHFNPTSMESFRKEFNLKLEDIRPMPFDAYYVSLLSEKYQSANGLMKTYLNAIWYGFKSNNQAKEPGQFSSNIYIFSKSES